MEGKEGERLFLCRVSLSYPTKNPASVIQIFLQASGAGTDCRHDYPGDSHLQAELEMRARESIMNFLCSHRQELSLIIFSGCSTLLSYTERWPVVERRGTWDTWWKKSFRPWTQNLENRSRETSTGKPTRDFSEHRNHLGQGQKELSLQPSLCPWLVGREKLGVGASASLELPSLSLIWRDTQMVLLPSTKRALPYLKSCLVFRCCGIKAEQIITSLAGLEAWRDLESGFFSSAAQKLEGCVSKDALPCHSGHNDINHA